MLTIFSKIEDIEITEPLVQHNLAVVDIIGIFGAGAMATVWQAWLGWVATWLAET